MMTRPQNPVLLVALEGVDGVGKTSAIKALMRRRLPTVSLLQVPAPYLKLRPYVDSGDKHARFLYHLASLRQALISDNKARAAYFLCDRYLPSLFAYSHVFHRLDIDTFLRYMAPFWSVVPKESAAVVLTCSRQVLLSRLRHKRKLNAVEQAIIADASIARRLDRAFRLYYDQTRAVSHARWDFVDTSTLTPSEVADLIVTRAVIKTP